MPKSPRSPHSNKKRRWLSLRKKKRTTTNECSPALLGQCMRCFPEVYDTRDAAAKQRQRLLKERMRDSRAFTSGVQARLNALPPPPPPPARSRPSPPKLKRR